MKRGVAAFKSQINLEIEMTTSVMEISFRRSGVSDNAVQILCNDYCVNAHARILESL
jgi:alkylhydroperoxidase family enzyme